MQSPTPPQTLPCDGAPADPSGSALDVTPQGADAVTIPVSDDMAVDYDVVPPVRERESEGERDVSLRREHDGAAQSRAAKRAKLDRPGPSAATDGTGPSGASGRSGAVGRAGPSGTTGRSRGGGAAPVDALPRTAADVRNVPPPDVGMVAEAGDVAESRLGRTGRGRGRPVRGRERAGRDRRRAGRGRGAPGRAVEIGGPGDAVPAEAPPVTPPPPDEGPRAGAGDIVRAGAAAVAGPSGAADGVGPLGAENQRQVQTGPVVAEPLAVDAAEARRARDKARKRLARDQETAAERELRLQRDRERKRLVRWGGRQGRPNHIVAVGRPDGDDEVVVDAPPRPVAEVPSVSLPGVGTVAEDRDVAGGRLGRPGFGRGRPGRGRGRADRAVEIGVPGDAVPRPETQVANVPPPDVGAVTWDVAGGRLGRPGRGRGRPGRGRGRPGRAVDIGGPRDAVPGPEADVPNVPPPNVGTVAEAGDVAGGRLGRPGRGRGRPGRAVDIGRPGDAVSGPEAEVPNVPSSDIGTVAEAGGVARGRLGRPGHGRVRPGRRRGRLGRAVDIGRPGDAVPGPEAELPNVPPPDVGTVAEAGDVAGDRLGRPGRGRGRPCRQRGRHGGVVDMGRPGDAVPADMPPPPDEEPRAEAGDVVRIGAAAVAGPSGAAGGGSPSGAKNQQVQTGPVVTEPLAVDAAEARRARDKARKRLGRDQETAAERELRLQRDRERKRLVRWGDRQGRPNHIVAVGGPEGGHEVVVDAPLRPVTELRNVPPPDVRSVDDVGNAAAPRPAGREVLEVALSFNHTQDQGPRADAGTVGRAGAAAGTSVAENEREVQSGSAVDPPLALDVAEAKRARERERKRLARDRETIAERELRLQRERERRRLARWGGARGVPNNAVPVGGPGEGDEVRADAPPLPAAEVRNVPPPDVGNVGEAGNAEAAEVPGVPPLQDTGPRPEFPDLPLPPNDVNLDGVGDALAAEVPGVPQPQDVEPHPVGPEVPDLPLPPNDVNVGQLGDAAAAEGQDIPLPHGVEPRPVDPEVPELLLPPNDVDVEELGDAAAAEVQDIPLPHGVEPRPADPEVPELLLPPNDVDVGGLGDAAAAEVPVVPIPQVVRGAGGAGNGAVPDPPVAEVQDAEPAANADQAAPGVIRGDPRMVARNYEPGNFAPLPGIQLGRMATVCQYCGALRWANEAAGVCCRKGNVDLAFPPPPPDELQQLLTPGTEFYREFHGKIRAYNTAFQLASLGCNVVRMDGRCPTFTVQGNVCHRIGSLLPVREGEEQFMQLYFLDADEANERRATMCGGLDREVINILLGMLHQHNNYVRALRPALAMARGVPNCQIVLSAEDRPLSEHERRFNLPVGREVAVMMPNEIRGRRDIIVHQRDGQLFRIDELSRQYEPMLYVLLHPDGKGGWSIELKDATGVTLREYTVFHMRFRPGNFNLIPRCGRLYQQYLVDSQARVESQRLSFVRNHQDGFTGFRAETIRGVQDALADGEEHARAVGQRVVLPSSVTGSPRYMMSKLQDALCYVRDFGEADFFITVTCNPYWPEIVTTLRDLFPGEGPDGHALAADHPDIVSQVFDLKLKTLLHQLNGGILGRRRAILHTIEWQKRGLPHAHILLWVHLGDKPRLEDVDACVCAEIPDPEADPELHEIVVAKMVHGPCGALNPRSTCMKNGKCSAGYPKAYQDVTTLPERSYPRYRRRSPEDGGRRAMAPGRGGVEIDNRWIVPYNPSILRSLDSHVNVEIITYAVGAIRYCIKYITKGSDQIMFAVRPDGVLDEIANYQNGRYLGAMEAAWRLLDRPIHAHYPPVQQLHLHLDGDQRRVVFRDDANLEAVLRGEENNPSMLTCFFDLCERDAFAARLLYTEVPRYFTWQVRRRGDDGNMQPPHWRRRREGALVEIGPGVYEPGILQSDTLSRVYTTTPRAGELYYLRLLLHHVRGPRSYEHLRTVGGRVCPTMREACSELGLLDDGAHWARAMEEATVSRFAAGLRFLFALILIEGEDTCDPMGLWMTFRDAMSDDIARRQRLEIEAGRPGLNMEQVREAALRKIARILLRLHGRSLAEYGLPVPPVLDDADEGDEPVAPEFDPVAQADHVQRDEPRLTDDQRAVYDEVMRRLDNGESGVIFLQAPGGCGKTFLENLLLAKVRSEGRVAVAVAASGIAAGLLEAGTTAHHRFKIPVQLHDSDENVCSISRRSPEADHLRRCRLIVWDEAAMMNRRATEAVDRMLQDIRGNQDLFGGVLTVMSGDWRQILPVVKNGGRAQVVDACLKSSALWPRVDTMELATNMRALNGDDEAGAFADFLLRVGDGRLPVVAVPDTVQVPEPVRSPAANLDDLVGRVFPEIADRYQDEVWLHERAILAPLNACVDRANDTVLALLPGQAVTYLSVNTISDEDNPERAPPIPAEILNTIEVSGLPSHEIKLKVGAPVVLMRNIDAPRAVNGTLCTVIRAAANVLELKIASGAGRGEILLLPRLPLPVSARDSGIGRPFRRLQFPVKLAFAMTINRCQGQTKRRVGIYLPAPVFTHGQLYVALSRVGSFEAVEVVSTHNHHTRNVVYREVL